MTITLAVKEDASDYSSKPSEKMQNPHDKFFKETFSHIGVARRFLHNYLPSEITEFLDTGTLRLEKDSFIDNKLKESFSDLLFSTDIDGREGYIYFLFDHKSYPDKAVGLQLLKYMAEIWNTKIKKEKVKSVPPVIPLVIYHGTSGWHIEKTLGGMISGFNNFPPILRKYTPDYEYLVYDLTNYSDEEIKGEARVRILFTLFRDVRKVENVYELLDIINKAVTYLRELEDKQTGVEYFETLMRYIFSAAKILTGEDAGKIADKVGKTYPEGSEVIMTLAEILREEEKRKERRKVWNWERNRKSCSWQQML